MLAIGPDFFSKSASAFLKGVGVRGVSPFRNSLLLGVCTSELEEVVASGRTCGPLGVFSGLYSLV